MQGIFKEELKRLLERFTEMGLDVGEQIYQATKSFIDHDRELAQSVVEHDEKVNVAEVRLEDQAINLMALQQPVANDFRDRKSVV